MGKCLYVGRVLDSMDPSGSPWESLGKESRLQDFGRDITRFRSVKRYLQDRVRKPAVCEVLESCHGKCCRGGGGQQLCGPSF